ncbi:hypothetical protein [Senegalia massiliensis]|uniref:Uncharacterized protein n=1 Tax=Senegalia massiliensis TaxID=1720316 RepID=A0A845R229_9CLOT|nr:hypothetical protein [Senegalia massiliensis]NBI06633.1 hypothetical protein [Senegalia massiliensis]
MKKTMEDVYGITETEGKESIKEFVKNMGIRNSEDWTEYFYRKYLELDIHKKMRFWSICDEESRLDIVFYKLDLLY